MDSRVTKLAEVFIDHSLNVKRGDKLVISTSDLIPIDIIKASYAYALKKNASVYLDIMGWNFLLDRSSYGDLRNTFYDNASMTQIKNPPTIYKDIIDWGDKFLRLTTFDNYAYLNNTDEKKIRENAKANNKWFHEMIDNKAWVLTYYPTEAFAQNSGVSMTEMNDLYFNSVLVDYKKMKKNGRAVKRLLDKAKIVRVVGDRTDLTIDISKRIGSNSYGIRNIPDGEVYYAPVHMKTEGHIFYDLPYAKAGKELNGVYLEFKEGKVVKASAEVGEESLKAGLNSDEGARYLGELGVGMNYGIPQVMRNSLFDEKLGGTLHITLGAAYPYKEGGNPGKDRNVSSIHWDLIKDMRKKGSYVEVDGKVMFRNGKWLV